MIHSGSGPLPRHVYAFVDSTFIRRGRTGFKRCVWFGLHAHPGRMWGCHVMLECGAVYRNVPPHAVAFSSEPGPASERSSQRWDCYGRSFSLTVYDYLYGLDARLRDGRMGSYLFTAIPLGDAFSEEPEQAKEFMFMRTFDDRLAILPTNDVLFIERSFTDRAPAWPTDIASQTGWWSCESEPLALDDTIAAAMIAEVTEELHGRAGD